jgi:hypothetical protein
VFFCFRNIKVEIWIEFLVQNNFDHDIAKKENLLPPSSRENKQGVHHTHCGLAIYIKKYLNAKEELWKLTYFTMQKNQSSKNPLKETKILHYVITNLKFQHKPKYHLSKILIY